MRLDALLAGLECCAAPGAERVEVTGIAVDSRLVRPGDLFVALAGASSDGRRYARDAARRGAVAILADGEVDALGLPVIRVADARALVGLLAARIEGDPSADLTVVGVTGTNGKTTTTYLLESIWRAGEVRTGVVGTIAYRFGDIVRPAPWTTPDAPVIQGLLAEMRAAGVTHVAMEVSSHALAQRRVDGLRFDAAVFTNLTRDHLDYHGSLAAYAAAKARLFTELLPASGKPRAVAVVNVDDATGRELVRQLRTRIVTVGRHPKALVRLEAVESTLGGTTGVLRLGDERLEFRSPLVGVPHAENVAVACATAWALGVPPATIEAGIAAAQPPPGRVERIPGPGFTVVVDYAHTPDALERLLATLRPLTPGRLITVFGCGGDRDRGKRPLMGEAAARASELVILTSDNPRTEDPLRILAEIEEGVRAGGLRPAADGAGGERGYCIEADRRAAIARAVRSARPGDVVVVAGKGHEDYQIVGSARRHLDDREEVRRALEELS